MTPPKYYRSIAFFVCISLFSFSCREHVKDHPGQNDDRANLSYEELAQTSASVRLNQLADSVFEVGEYNTALHLYQQAMDSAAVEADSFLYYDSRLDIASVYDRLGERAKAVEIGEQVTQAFIRSGDSVRIGRAYTALAGFYGKANMPRESKEASYKGFEILKQQGPLIQRCAIYNQMAFLQSDQGNWAAALPLLDTALQLMEASEILNQRPGMRLNIGDCHRNLGNWDQARQYLTAAIAEADSLHQAHVLARALERFSQVAEATGDPKQALQLFRRAKGIRDSLFSENKAKNLQELEVRYQTREKEQELKLLRADEKLKTSQRNLLLLAIFFVITVMGLALYLQRLRLRNIRHEFAQKQQEMTDFLALLMAKNTQLAHMKHQDQEAPAPSESEDVLAESLYNNRILTDSDWELFKRRFEQLYPGYILRLRNHFPELSSGEERLFLLIKINLTGQEIANVLGITTNAVKKSRQRLRKRLALAQDVELETFVQHF